MHKKIAAKVGEEVLQNTLTVIMNMADGDTMVIGIQELTKKEIIDKFWKDKKFAWRTAVDLDKSVKEYLFRTKFAKKRRKKRRSKNG